jgi:chaperonin GroES
MSFKPLADHVLVEQLEAKTQTASGLILPSSDVEKPQRATVVAVGPGKRLKDGSHSTMSVTEGDLVVFAKYNSGEKLNLDGKEFMILKESDILAKIVD